MHAANFTCWQPPSLPPSFPLSPALPPSQVRQRQDQRQHLAAHIAKRPVVDFTSSVPLLPGTGV